MSIVFRVDAIPGLGIGHLMRCLSFAGELKKTGHKIHFICTDEVCELTQIVIQQGYSLHSISAQVQSSGMPTYDWQADGRATLDVLASMDCRIEWLIVDHYELDQRWEEMVSDGSQVRRLMVIDDLANRPHCGDLLLDQTYGREEADYRSYVSASCHLMLGPDYAPLRPEFGRLRTIINTVEKQQVDRVLISLGGFDQANLVPEILTALVASGAVLDVDLVSGRQQCDLEGYVEQTDASNIQLHIHSHVNDMAELMAKADLVIGAAGTTSWERCCLGLPTIMFATAPNQVTNLHQLSKVGAVIGIDVTDVERLSKFQQAFTLLMHDAAVRFEMASTAASLCDGFGAVRLYSHLFPETAQDGGAVSLRRAGMHDAERLLEWQLVPETRRYSRNKNAPSRKEHYAWMHKRMHDLGCIFNIILYSGQPAGYVRLDHQRLSEHPYRFEISIAIAPEYYRRGIAQAALRQLRKTLDWADLYAAVDSRNTASKNLFESLNFSPTMNGYLSLGNLGLLN